MQPQNTTQFRPSAPGTPNLVLNGDGFHVSYNDRDTWAYGCVTTALVVGQIDRFYILNGDHRAQYAVLVGDGLDTCLAYFEEHLDDINHRSDQLETACVQSPSGA